MDKAFFITKMEDIMMEIGSLIICMDMVSILYIIKSQALYIIQMVIQHIKDLGIKINSKVMEYYTMK